MSNTTKRALELSLKKLLMKKPLDKITINDLTSDCEISRMTFYYHFKDIYDLVEWICLEDAKRALQGKSTYDTWQQGLEQVFEAVLENKQFVMNVYHSLGREKIEIYLYELMNQLLIEIVEEKSVGKAIKDDEKAFVAGFFKYGFVGVMLDWVKQGLKADYQEIVEKMTVGLEGVLAQSIENFTKHGK